MSQLSPAVRRPARQKRFRAEFRPRKRRSRRSVRGRATWRNQVRLRDSRRADCDAINFRSIEWVIRTLADDQIRPEGPFRSREIAIDLTDDRRQQLALEEDSVFDTLLVRLRFNRRGDRARVTGAEFAWKAIEQFVREPKEQFAA